MKSQAALRCLLFALVVPVAACGGGDRGNSKPLAKESVSTPTPAPTPEAPKPGFGEKPVVKAELAVVEHYIPTKFSECMSLGKELAAKGEQARARELFEAAAKLDRKQAEPMVELARSYIATNDKALAIRHANKAVKLAPESSQAYNTLGRAELLRHDYEAATLAFRQATELNADNVWAWNNLGLVYITQKNYAEAVNALVEATGRKGNESYMWNNLGTAYEQLDKLDEARDAFEKGASMGSTVAKASRKRLEGVDTIVVVKTAKVEKKDAPKPPAEQTYETREPSPEDVVDFDDEENGGSEVDADVPADEVLPEAKPVVKPEAGSASPQTTL
jgi:hypothetical protein